MAATATPPPAKRVRRTLDEKTAWEIATAVGEPLRGRVRLAKSDQREPFARSSYEWIELACSVQEGRRFRTPLDWVARARVACVVWYMLSCCEGFRGHEHPRFWKKLLDSLSGGYTCVSDAHDFFPSADRQTAFPRFRLVVTPSVLAMDAHDALDEEDSESDGDLDGMDVEDNDADFGEDDDLEDDGGDENECISDDEEYSEDDIEGMDDEDNGVGVEGDEDVDDNGREESECTSDHESGQDERDHEVLEYEDSDKHSSDEEDEVDDCDEDIAAAYAAVREFVGLDDVSIDSQAAEHVRFLLHHVDEDVFLKQPIEISLSSDAVIALDGFATKIKCLERAMEYRTQTTTNVERRNELVEGYIRFPVTKLKEFIPLSLTPIDEVESLGHASDIVDTCHVAIPLVEINPNPRMGNGTLAAFLRVCHYGRSADIKRLSFDFEHATARQTEMVFSSIPITNVREMVFSSSSRVFSSDEVGWTWLAYALYHPWTQLDFVQMSVLDVSESTAAPIRSVIAAHSALYRLLYGEEDDSISIEGLDQHAHGHYVTLKVHPRILWFRNRSLQGGKVVETDNATVLTAVVKYDVRQVEQLPDVVCVIVPIIGHGFIAKGSVLDLILERTDGSSASSFSLICPGRQLNLLLSSVPLIKNVVRLEIGGQSHLSSAQLLEVFRTCPKLQHIRVNYNGAVFHEWSEITSASDASLSALELETLVLCGAGSFKPPSKAARSTCLAHLSTLIVTTSGDPGTHQQSVQAALNDGYSIEKFVWNAQDRARRVIPYEENLAYASEVLSIVEGKNDRAMLPLTEKAKLAFASVIKRCDAVGGLSEVGRASHALGKLNQDIVQYICGASVDPQIPDYPCERWLFVLSNQTCSLRTDPVHGDERNECRLMIDLDPRTRRITG